jgi:hypothetical protein
MRRAVVILGLLGVVLSRPSLACDLEGPMSAPMAAEVAQGAVPEKLVQDLIEWIGAHSDYDIRVVRADPPEIRFCRTGEVITYDGTDLQVDALMLAAYDLGARRIYLVEPWSVTEIRSQARLLHELIHDVQFANRTWACSQASEMEAYRLTDAWLAAQGLESGFDWFRIYLLSRCPAPVGQ